MDAVVVVLVMVLVAAAAALLVVAYRGGWFVTPEPGGAPSGPTVRSSDSSWTTEGARRAVPAPAPGPSEPLDGDGSEQVEVLSPEDLWSRLRIKIDRLDPVIGRTPLARPISPGYEARVVLLGLADRGPGGQLPPSIRHRLPTADHALFELALDRSLPDELPVVTQAPGPARLWQVPGWVWLCVPKMVFGDEPALIVAGDLGLLWAELDRQNLEQDLAGLCGQAARGPLPSALWTWDGSGLTEATVTRRSGADRGSGAEGPTWVVRLPRHWADVMGVEPVLTTRFN